MNDGDNYKKRIQVSENPRDDWKEMTDEALVEIARDGNQAALECLVYRYKNFVRMRAHSYYIKGADSEDLTQEGMIGLYKATRDFRSSMDCPFRVFAELCITRQIINAVKNAARQKHIPLNSSVSLNLPLDDEDTPRTLADVIDGSFGTNPETLFIGREECKDIGDKIEALLSSFEANVLVRYLQGMSYQNIACVTRRDAKAVDNALQRAKRKLMRYLQSGN